MTNKIKIKKLHRDAVIPKYATAGAACFDLHSIDQELVAAGASETFRTGLAFEIPKDHVMLVFSRSGHGFNNDVRLANCVGVIDSDYRGEVMVKLTNDQDTLSINGSLAVRHGDRIAQAMIVPVQQVEFNVVAQLSETERGTGGFGSTGA